MRKTGVCLISLVCIGLSVRPALAQEVRPVRDDVGYCWRSEQMQRLLDFIAGNEGERHTSDAFVAGISPHDDYLYAARVYYPLYKSIRVKEAIIFGVTHRAVGTAIGNPRDIVILDSHASWRGLSREVPISPLRGFITGRLDTSYFAVNNRAHELEHSIEGLLPYLQYFSPEVRITPVMITAMSFDRMEQISGALAQLISDYLRNNHLVPGKDFVMLISSDANHYGRDFNNIPFGDDDAAHQKATRRDRELCDAYLSGPLTTDKIRNLTISLDSVVWCGRYSVPFGLLTVQKTMQLLEHQQVEGSILRYSDSYTEGVIPLKNSGMGTTAPFSLKHWVGWFTAAYSLRNR